MTPKPGASRKARNPKQQGYWWLIRATLRKKTWLQVSRYRYPHFHWYEQIRTNIYHTRFSMVFFHSSLPKVPPISLEVLVVLLNDTCYWDLPNCLKRQILTSLETKRSQKPTPGCCDLGTSMKLTVRGGILKICMVPKLLEDSGPRSPSCEKRRTTIWGKIVLKQKGVEEQWKRKKDEKGTVQYNYSVVSECALRFRKPREEIQNWECFATLQTHHPYHPPRYSLAISWLSGWILYTFLSDFGVLGLFSS